MKETLTYNSIMEELKDVPEDRLEEPYAYVHSLTVKPAIGQRLKSKIISYAGILESMPDEDYNEFLQETRNTRNNLFNRKLDL